MLTRFSVDTYQGTRFRDKEYSLQSPQEIGTTPIEISFPLEFPACIYLIAFFFGAEARPADFSAECL
jgi:hypothetical protein